MSGIRVTSLVALVAAAVCLASCSSSPPGSSASSSSTTSSTSASAAGTQPTTGVTLNPSTGTAVIPEADRSPAGTAGQAPTVVVPKSAAPTELQSADLITGTGPAATSGDTVEVQYVLATYSSGKVVQSSWTSQPFSFTLGQGQVIEGWDKGVVGMQVGGRRELIIPPSLGYGSTSPGPGIAANDTLIFVIDMLKIS
jgi:peptidylprolyl isomerase